eukprot:926390-Prorocentrum_minimum.AAC.1
MQEGRDVSKAEQRPTHAHTGRLEALNGAVYTRTRIACWAARRGESHRFDIAMALYLASLSSSVKLRDLEDEFDYYGKCQVQLKTGYAYIYYDNNRDADDALRYLNGKKLRGCRLRLERKNKDSSRNSRRS